MINRIFATAVLLFLIEVETIHCSFKGSDSRLNRGTKVGGCGVLKMIISSEDKSVTKRKETNFKANYKQRRDRYTIAPGIGK